MSAWDQNSIRRLINTTYFLCIQKIGACDHLKTNNLSADNFKRYSTSMDRYLSPRYGRMILVSGYPVLTAVNWSQRGCAISGYTWAHKLLSIGRKCEIKHWFPCVRTDGRQRCTVMWLPHFLGWIDFLSYGAPLKRALRPRGAPL